MKNLLFLVGLAVLLAGCNVQPSASSTVNNTTALAPAASSTPDPDAPSYQAVSAADVEAQKILGSYVGAFGDNKITLLITKVVGNTVSGRSIVGGNDRPFDGTFSAENTEYTVVANEPGDHKDDGVFRFTVSSADPS